MPHKHCANCGYPKDATFFESENAVYCRACLSFTRPNGNGLTHIPTSELINCIRNTMRQALDEHDIETAFLPENFTEKEALLPEIRKITKFMLENFTHELRHSESAIDTAIRLLKEFSGAKEVKGVADETACSRRSA